MKNSLLLILLSSFFSACNSPLPENEKEVEKSETIPLSKTSIIILGTIQDAGSPHIACKKECCKKLFDSPDPKRLVVSLGLFDAKKKKNYLFEATPDISRQVKMLKKSTGSESELPDGIFLTHAHIGHYAGLMYLGKEATDSNSVPVYAMPRMADFLQNSGPWSQLVQRKNIVIQQMQEVELVALAENLFVSPFKVPHRDEYSETVGYTISGPNKKALFIPDIDKWTKWEKDIVEEIKKVDYAFLDATFYSSEELNNRDISQIPHPFVIESVDLFKKLDKVDREKVIFIHFNHTNPIIDPESSESIAVKEQGFRIARMGDVFEL